MRTLIAALALGLLASCAATTEAEIDPTVAGPTGVSVAATAAVADTNRPQADRDRDAQRHPAEMLAFAQVTPGQQVADLIPGGGYFTRLFSSVVGPRGHVYGVISPQQAANTQNPPPINALAADPTYTNVSALVSPFTDLPAPQPLDLVWTAQNYHDLHLARFNLDVAAVNRAIFNALKPGGLYVIVDHSAVAGAGLSVADTLHRIDQAIVRREVEAAGFVYEGELDVLRNPADARTVNVFEPSIRGNTDQFVMRFRKPR